MSEMLNCPCCGEQSTVHKWYGGYRVVCNNRDSCSVRTDVFETAEKAIAAWSRRKEANKYKEQLDELVKLLTPVIGKILDQDGDD